MSGQKREVKSELADSRRQTKNKRRDQDQEIIKALRRDPNPKMVASEVGVHISTVYRAIERNGVDLELLRELHRCPSGVEHATYRMLVASGVPASEVARSVGVSESYVSQVVNKKQVA